MRATWVRSRGLAVLSCFTSKNSTNDVYNLFLHVLEMEVRAALASKLGVIMGGYFNTKSLAWGSAVLDARGASLVSLVARPGLFIENVGSVPTFRRQKYSPVIDITMYLPGVAL